MVSEAGPSGARGQPSRTMTARLKTSRVEGEVILPGS
jgi:hypothetical protein